jgi:RNA polymerase sigma-70 factor (ECF subfamily)
VNAEVFERQRPRLTAIAYGILGSAMEAEDVVQDAWLRWDRTDREAVTEPAAFLATVVTRLSIDRLRSARMRREAYVGPWLPEPIVTELGEDPADVVVEAESISLALMTALERLNPVERAVLLLREVFDYDYAEIGPMVGRLPATCRQIAARARGRIGEIHRARPVEPEQQRDLVEGFMAAVVEGDVEGLVDRLAADAVLWSDGGGHRRAARHPVHGADRIAVFMVNVTRRAIEEGGSGRLVRVNGGLGVRLEMNGTLYGITTFEFEEGLVTAIRSIVSPDKLRHLADG